MKTHAMMAAELMRSAAEFFRAIGNGNPEQKDAMHEHAEVFEKIAALVETDPLGGDPDG